MAGLTGKARADEIARHEARKAEIENDLETKVTLTLVGEGITETLIGVVIVGLYALLALMMAPEPVFSKLVAVLIGVGIGIFAVGALVAAILLSKSLLNSHWTIYRSEETIEDLEHQQRMGGG